MSAKIHSLVYNDTEYFLLSSGESDINLPSYVVTKQNDFGEITIGVWQECLSEDFHAGLVKLLMEGNPLKAAKALFCYMCDHDTDGASVSEITSLAELKDELPAYWQEAAEEVAEMIHLD